MLLHVKHINKLITYDVLWYILPYLTNAKHITYWGYNLVVVTGMTVICSMVVQITYWGYNLVVVKGMTVICRMVVQITYWGYNLVVVTGMTVICRMVFCTVVFYT